MEEALALQILGSTSAAVSDVRGKSWTTFVVQVKCRLVGILTPVRLSLLLPS
jgi:hypothetical protein